MYINTDENFKSRKAQSKFLITSIVYLVQNYFFILYYIPSFSISELIDS